MAFAFDNPYMYWIGLNLDAATEKDTAEFHEFFNNIHVPEVFAGNPGFAALNRFHAVDEPRAPETPEYLQMWEIADAEGEQIYIDRATGVRTDRPVLSPGPEVWEKRRSTAWRMVWRKVAESAPPSGVPESVRIVGLNPPEDADEKSLDALLDWYTGDHLDGVIAARKLTRATTWVCERDLLPDGPKAPRIVTVFESPDPNLQGDLQSATRPAGSAEPRAQGPEIWSRTSGQWRLTFRRFATFAP